MDFISFGVKKNEETNQYEPVITSAPVGQITGSEKHDFYVYEWFIVETGEIFYVGKGRGNRYKEYHERAREAEKIRESYQTDVRFVAQNLSETEAVELESTEMLRVLNETTDRLTNRMIPFTAKRGNGFDPSPSTPILQCGKAPVLWACEIDEHYFGMHHRCFDDIDIGNLKSVHFIDKKVFPQTIASLYGNRYNEYLDKVSSWLKSRGFSIVKSKYAKSVTAWIYIGDDDVHNYNIDQKAAEERLGRNIPVYHLIDLWNYINSL